MHLERAVTPSLYPLLSFGDPRLFYYPAPYPGFEGVVLGHVIQQRGQRVDLQVNTAHFLPGLEGQGSEHPSQSSLVTPIPWGRVKTPLHNTEVYPTPLHLKLPSKTTLPAMGPGWEPQALPPPPVEVAGRGRCPPPEEQGGMVPRSSGEAEVGMHHPGHPPSRRPPQ